MFGGISRLVLLRGRHPHGALPTIERGLQWVLMGGFMRRRRFAGLPLVLPLILVGCTIYIGSNDDETGGPVSQGGDVVSPEEAQQAREAEAWAHTANVVYKGGEVLYSFELPSGDILDFIKRDT